MIGTSLLLEALKCGEVAEVDYIEGEKEWVARMAELGLRPGEEVRMLQPGSPCLVSLGGSRLSLRLGSAGRVYVRRTAVASRTEQPDENL